MSALPAAPTQPRHLRLVSHAADRLDFSALRRAARHDRALSDKAFRLLDDVCELAERTGVCTASQTHFAERYGVSRRSVIRWERELAEAGYVAVGVLEADQRRRTLTPSEATPPQSEIGDKPCAIGDTGRHVSPPDTGHPASPVSEIGDKPRPEIGDKSRHAPRVYISPLGEREGARAHTREGWPAGVSELVDTGPHARLAKPDDPPAVAVYASRAGRRPTALQADQVRQRVGVDLGALTAWASVCETWAATHEPLSGTKPYNLANVDGMLRHLAEQRETAAPGATGSGFGGRGRDHDPTRGSATGTAVAVAEANRRRPEDDEFHPSRWEGV